MSDDKLGPALPPRKKVTHFISAQLDNKTQATNQKAGPPKDESEML